MPTSCGGGTKFCCREPDLSPPASKHFIKTGGYALRTRSKEESTTLRWNAKPGSPSMPTSCGGGTKFCCRGRDLSPPELKKRSVTASGSALRQRSKEGWNPTANENREFGTLNWSSRPPRNVGGTWGCRREASWQSQKPSNRLRQLDFAHFVANGLFLSLNGINGVFERAIRKSPSLNI